MIKKAFVFLGLVLILSSCASNKKIIYLNEAAAGTTSSLVEYQNKLQPDDNLIITVTADEPTLAAPFNLMYVNSQTSQLTNINSSDALTSYLIDQNGEIDFAGIGKVKLSGLTRIEAENKIKELVSREIVDPVINLRLINFKVSVMGEVLRPGTIRIVGDRVTILEALSLAGDMTIYGKREDIMVIREANGAKTVNYVDITDKDIINSPFYYLDQNDLIYVKPNKTRVNSSVIGPNLTVGISALSLVVTIIALSLR
ncbi:MAG: polysaccharide export protein [Flavobacterium sp.]|nr:MAG: polysaccharide export protein [Flavobacterium sp.]